MMTPAGVLRFVAQQHGFQRDNDHFVKGGLAFRRRGRFVTQDVVGHGADGQRLAAELFVQPAATP